MALIAGSVVLHDAVRGQWLRFRDPVAVIAVDQPGAVSAALGEVEERVQRDGLYAAGFLCYEAAAGFDEALVCHHPIGGVCPLLWFGLYSRAEPVAFPGADPGVAPMCAWRGSVGPDHYAAAFRRIKEYIGAGDTYQVNYSYRLRAPFAADPWALFVRMVQAQGAGYSAFISGAEWAVCSASPELFFTLEDGVLVSRPMKGTMPRGLTQAEDSRQAVALRRSEKNRAENLMIVDMVRNDLGRIAVPGSVRVSRLFELEKYPTLWQMTSRVQCRTRCGISQIFRHTFPAASITGAPKVRTMEIIRELEPDPRQIYTGSIGFITPAGRAQFNVAIRTVLVDRRQRLAEYGVGGGVVWDSEATDEQCECAVKAEVLVRLQPEFSLLETMLWTPGEGYDLLDYHLDRLLQSGDYFARPVNPVAVRTALAACAAGLPPMPHRVRLCVPAAGEPIVEASPLGKLADPYRVTVAAHPVDAGDPFLYHKTTHRRAYDDARQGVEGVDDVLLWNEAGEATESCIGNLVVERAGRLVTPPVRCGLLAGTYRRRLLENGIVIEAPVRLEELADCRGIYLVNSVRGMWPVTLVHAAECPIPQNALV